MSEPPKGRDHTGAPISLLNESTETSSSIWPRPSGTSFENPIGKHTLSSATAKKILIRYVVLDLATSGTTTTSTGGGAADESTGTFLTLFRLTSSATSPETAIEKHTPSSPQPRRYTTTGRARGRPKLVACLECRRAKKVSF